MNTKDIFYIFAVQPITKDMTPQAQKQETQHISNDKCVLYYRVSRNVMSDTRQERDCIDHCNKHNIQITETFREKISGRITNRPKMTECIDYVKKNNIKYLICSELSRLGRTDEVVPILDELTKENICVITLKESIQTMKFNDKGKWVKDDDQMMMARMLMAIYIKESDTIAYRIKSGLRNAVLSKGNSTGGKFLSYGYTSVKDKEAVNKGQLIKDDREAEVIKLIFDKYSNAGWGSIKIANYLNLINIPTRTGKALWNRSTINQIIPNPIYKGYRLFYNEPLPYNKDLQIVDDITFNTANERMKASKNSNGDFNKLKKYNYLFDKGIIKCQCGRNFFGIHKHNLYKCVSGKYSKGCGNKSVKQNWIESEILLYLLEHWTSLIDDEKVLNEALEGLQINLSLHKQEQQKLTQRLERIQEQYLDGELNKIKYEEKREQTKEQLNKLIDEIHNTEDKINSNTKISLATFKNNYISNGETIPLESTISKDTVQKLLKQVTVTTNTIDILMINGNTFQIERDTVKQKRIKADVMKFRKAQETGRKKYYKQQ